MAFRCWSTSRPASGPGSGRAGSWRRPATVWPSSRRRLVASRGEIADGVEGIQRLLEQRRAQLAGREAQLQASVVAAVGGCPYKGLARFEAADAANFFGRERLVAELVARLAGVAAAGRRRPVRQRQVVAGTGGAAAGAGRRGAARRPSRGAPPSSARAHTPPVSWPAASTTPTVPRAPRGPCSSTSSRRRSRWRGREASRTEFIRRLLELVDRPDMAVVLAIRADHLGRCAAYPELGRPA